jgi:hypothetical protein
MQIIAVRNDELAQYIGHEIHLDDQANGRWERIVAIETSPVQGINVVTTKGTYQACFPDMLREVNASTYWGDTYWASQNVGQD